MHMVKKERGEGRSRKTDDQGLKVNLCPILSRLSSRPTTALTFPISLKQQGFTYLSRYVDQLFNCLLNMYV